MEDLCWRLRIAEKDFYPKINALSEKIEDTNRYYNKLKGKSPNLWLQGMLIGVLTPIAVIFAEIAIIKEPKPGIGVFIAVTTSVITVALIILNIIRAKAFYAVRKKRADDWWERTGKPSVLTLKKSIDEIAAETADFLGENPLLYEIPQYLRTMEHCFAIYEILLQRRAVSLEEAFSVYSSDLSAEHRRWMEKYEENKRWEEFSERQAEMQRTLEQTKNELAYADLMLDEIRIGQKYGD